MEKSNRKPQHLFLITFDLKLNKTAITIKTHPNTNISVFCCFSFIYKYEVQEIIINP